MPSRPEASPDVHPIADFVFGEGDSLSAIFVYDKNGILSGLEVYGLPSAPADAAPTARRLRSESSSGSLTIGDTNPRDDFMRSSGMEAMADLQN